MRKKIVKPKLEQVNIEDREQAKRFPKTSCESGKKGSIGKQARQEMFLSLYPSNSFNLSKTARDVGCDPRTVYFWLDEDQDFQDRMRDLKESRIDIVESKLFEKASNGDVISCIFFLKTQAKSRGYVEQTKADLTVRQDFELTREEADRQRQEKDRIVEIALQAELARRKWLPVLGLDPNDNNNDIE